MRFSLVLAVLFSFGCVAKAPLPSGEPFRASDAAASFAAYQAYCGMCEKAETCCLRESDLAGSRWSATSGTYLRAMRDYYECQRIAVLHAASYSPSRDEPHFGSSFGQFTNSGDITLSCYPHACQDFADIMIAELDKSLAQPRPHVPGALVSCSNPEEL